MLLQKNWHERPQVTQKKKKSADFRKNERKEKNDDNTFSTIFSFLLFSFQPRLDYDDGSGKEDHFDKYK